MRRIERTGKFKRDYRKTKSSPRYRNLDGRLIPVLQLLAEDRPLPSQLRDHPLTGSWSGYRDCHLWPDLVLVCSKPSPDLLRLVRLGSHGELFK